MHPKQREITTLINNYQLADAFAALDQLVSNDPNYGRLKKTYLTGHTDVDFTDRLLVFVQSLQLPEQQLAMPDHKVHLKKLLQLGKMGQAINEMIEATEENGQSGLNNNLINISGRYHRNETSKRQGTITDSFYNMQLARLTDSLTHYIDDEYQPSGRYVFEAVSLSTPTSASTSPSPSPSPTRKVFISYSTDDREIADNIIEKLEAEGMTVSIDYKDFVVGDGLMDSIQKHLKANGIVLSLISKNSLKSKWVSKESMIMFHSEKMTDKLFIPVLIDDFLFEASSITDSLIEIKEKIKSINAEIERRKQYDIRYKDLSTDLDFYEELDHNFVNIVDKFKNRLAVDIRGKEFDTGIERIINRIQALPA